MRRIATLLLASAAPILLTSGAAEAQSTALLKRPAQKYTKEVFPTFAPEVLLKDERSRVFTVSKITVQKAKDCSRADRFMVDCNWKLTLVGTSPEKGEKADKTVTDCSGTLRVRKVGVAGLTSRLRDFECKARQTS